MTPKIREGLSRRRRLSAAPRGGVPSSRRLNARAFCGRAAVARLGQGIAETRSQPSY